MLQDFVQKKTVVVDVLSMKTKYYKKIDLCILFVYNAFVCVNYN